jgi:hypothetical protein
MSIKINLAPGIQLNIIRRIVIPLCEQKLFLNTVSGGPMLADDSMDNGDITAFDIVDDDIANVDCRLSVGQDEKVTTVENGFHASRKDNNDGGWRVGEDA